MTKVEQIQKLTESLKRQLKELDQDVEDFKTANKNFEERVDKLEVEMYRIMYRKQTNGSIN